MIATQASLLATNAVLLASATLMLALIALVWLARPPFSAGGSAYESASVRRPHSPSSASVTNVIGGS